jgi:hypothetical protein
VADRVLPGDPLAFIRECLREGHVLWTYHVNMRLGQRFIARDTIIDASASYELVEEYPEDKYLPSYLLLGQRQSAGFHVLFAVDAPGHNVRVVTAYYPDPEEWEADLKTRRTAK